MQENELVEIDNESNNIVRQAQSFAINTQTDLEYASSFLTTIKDTQKKISKYWEEPKKVAHDAHKKIEKIESDIKVIAK